MELDDRFAFPVAEAFYRIGVSRTRGYALIAAGELETFMIGKRRMASRRALEKFVATAEANSRKQAAA